MFLVTQGDARAEAIRLPAKQGGDGVGIHADTV
jgi:hypothetical protein